MKKKKTVRTVSKKIKLCLQVTPHRKKIKQMNIVLLNITPLQSN